MAAGAAMLAVLCQGGCSLEEITLVESEDVVVAEVYVQLFSPYGEDRATAWLHRTLESGSPASQPVPGASILITSPRGFSLELAETVPETCVLATPVQGTGTCYATSTQLAGRFQPGEELTVEITLPDGGVIRGVSVVPGDFDLIGPAVYGGCAVEADTPTELRWTRSEGAWAYVNESLILGLRQALAPRGIEVEQDPLYLLGVSVSASDTTIVFPGEFGVFDRFDLDQDVALALQEGLPAGASAQVTISAADRNYVNWIRGGNFNPSGLVRIPSLRGAGTGVFGTSLTWSLGIRVRGAGPMGDLPLCASP